MPKKNLYRKNVSAGSTKKPKRASTPVEAPPSPPSNEDLQSHHSEEPMRDQQSPPMESQPNPEVEHSPSKNPEHSETVNTEDSTLDSDAHIIFQCASCLTVVGDTMAEYEAYFESRTLCLKAASNVTIDEELHISRSGFDVGCTFKRILCSSCEHHLGRIYASTSPNLDSLRSSYTFDHSALISYQLGSSRTLDGQHLPIKKCQCFATPGLMTKIKQQVTDIPRPAVDVTAFEARVTSLSEATDRAAITSQQNKMDIAEMRHAFTKNNSSVDELRASLEYAQNMILLWEDRFQRLGTCEKRLSKLTSDFLHAKVNGLLPSQGEEPGEAVRRLGAHKATRQKKQTPLKSTLSIQKKRRSQAPSPLTRKT